VRVKYCQQGSQEWLEARAGCSTASAIKALVTTKGAKTTSTTRDTYLNAVIAEKMSGKPVDTFRNDDMLRGTERESEARDFFATILDVDIKEVGFYLLDDHDIGCSPDGVFTFDEKDCAIEIKCPRASTHVRYMKNKKLPTEYIQQVQMQMHIMEIQSMFFASYHPDLKPFIIEVKKDDEFFEKALPILIEADTYVKSQTEILNGQPIFFTFKSIAK